MAVNDVNNSAQVATQVATNTGTGGGSAGNNTTGSGNGVVTTSTPVVAPKGFRSELQLMLQGWQEIIPSDSTVTSSAGPLTEGAVLTQLQAYLSAYTDMDTHATAIKQARVEAKSQLAQARKYYSALKAAVTNLFGADSPQLAKFGLQPKRARTPLTSAELAVRAAKALATRELRGTKGPVQKADTKSGPMAFVDPVPKGAQSQASTPATPAPEVASTASSGSVGAASPPGNTGAAGQSAAK